MKLDALSIRNLRSLVRAQKFEMKPLMLVVGANSSGKSTFLRTFPLLRQSVETVTKGPILWFGRFVDFGVFNDVVSRGVLPEQIEFGFDVTLSQNASELSRGYYGINLPILSDMTVELTLVIAEAKGTRNTYTKHIRLSLAGKIIELSAEADGTVVSVAVDGNPIRMSVGLSLKSGASLFSVLVTSKSSPDESAAEILGPRRRTRGVFSEQVVEHLRPLFHGKAAYGKRAYVARLLGIGTCANVLTHLKTLASVTPTSAVRAKSEKIDSVWAKRLHELALVNRLPEILGLIDRFLSSTFGFVSYIGPLRATAERFYRQQDLAVDEVDPQGANLAMFLMGLTEARRDEFSNWCEENVGFSVKASPVGAHVSIHLRDSGDGEVFNIADMGFGYSQLLPVLATIWQALSQESRVLPTSSITRGMIVESEERIQKIIVIEQPELHLHPRLQAKLADLLCVIVREGATTESAVHLICETHSETIINEVGKLISKKEIEKAHVQVLLFERDGQRSTTNVTKSEYGEDGVLKNWPYGFFLPESD